MSFLLAIKAFIKTMKHPQLGKKFVEDDGPTKELQDRSPDHSHLRLLAMLQKSSRLIDFFKEDLSSLDDAQIGAAVRKIHTDCNQSLEEWVTLRPIMEEHEGTKIHVPRGYDPSKIRVVGKVKGEPPFMGTLRHKGWKAHKLSLPKKSGEQPTDVIFPAEVEII